MPALPEPAKPGHLSEKALDDQAFDTRTTLLPFPITYIKCGFSGDETNMIKKSIQQLLFFDDAEIFNANDLLDRESAWWGHVPFSHWLMEVSDPRLLVELGVHHGVSYFSFCEAVSERGLNTQCVAIDNWRGDAHSGAHSEETYERFRVSNLERFGRFSTILRMDFDKALDCFRDGTIDILHIDGYHTYASVSHDFSFWRRKLSKRSVVLFHDTNEFRSDFGVGRFFQELKKQYPSFEFLHSHGLGLICVGKRAPKEIRDLCSIRNDRMTARVRSKFASLGQNYVDLNALIRKKHAAIDSLSVKLSQSEKAVVDASEKIDNLIISNEQLKRTIEKHEQVIAAKFGEVELCNDKLVNALSEISSLSLEISSLNSSLIRNQTKNDSLMQEIEAANDLISQIVFRYRKEFQGRAGAKNEFDTARGLSPADNLRIILNSVFFDADFYLEQYPDVRDSGISPALHFLMNGGYEGRNPSKYFLTREYLFWNPQVEEVGLNPLVHFELYHNTENQEVPWRRRPRNHCDQYARWLELYGQLTSVDRRLIHDSITKFRHQPLISIIMPVYNPDPAFFKEAVQSILSQLYPNWELCIADDASTQTEFMSFLEEIASRETRIKWVRRPENGNISRASNTALELADGEFCALMDHDDMLSETALYEVAREINRNPDVSIIYSDEDHIDEHGVRRNPYFKTDFNLELFLGHNMISHLGVYRSSLIRKIGGFREGFEGSQDYDLALRAVNCCREAEIQHIPSVLYHWRQTSQPKSFSQQRLDECIKSAQLAKQDFFRQREENVEVAVHPLVRTWSKISRPISEPKPLVTVIIPTKNQAELLSACVEGVINRTNYKNLEVIIVDHESNDPATRKLLRDFALNANIRVIPYVGEFNYSDMNNIASSHAKGALLAFLNNDIDVIDPCWLDEMVSLATIPKYGIVGAKLLYEDDTIQHGGVILGMGGCAGHAFIGHAKDELGYFGRLVLRSYVSAVTGACMVVRKEVFEEVGGFEADTLKVTFNDIDLCLKVRERGYHNIWSPFALLYHKESASRGSDDTPEKRRRTKREASYMMEKWGEQLLWDPYYNPNLGLSTPNFDLAFPPRRRTPWIDVGSSGVSKGLS